MLYKFIAFVVAVSLVAVVILASFKSCRNEEPVVPPNPLPGPLGPLTPPGPKPPAPKPNPNPHPNPSPEPEGITYEGKITEIKSPTELTVRSRLRKRTVRLAGIASPDPNPGAMQYLQSVVGKECRVTAVSGDKHDLDGRVYLDDNGYDLTTELVRLGWVRVTDRQNDILVGLETTARDRGRGIWAADFSILDQPQ